MAKKKDATAVEGAQTPAPYNPADGYQPPPGGQYPGYGTNGPGAPATSGASITAPPPRNTAPWVNAKYLWDFKRPMRAVIKGVRDAVGGNPQYTARKGWFLDC